MYMRAKKPRKLSAKAEQERQERVKAAFGMFAHVKTSSEEFARRKSKEIEWEDRNRKPQ